MIQLYVDGASAGNPGKSGIGFFIKGEGHLIHAAIPIEPTTNHLAEFIALDQALGFVLAIEPTVHMVTVFSDSKVVVDSVQKGFTKNKDYTPLLESIQQKASQFDLFFLNWLTDKQNKAADHLARQAIHLKEPSIRYQS